MAFASVLALGGLVSASALAALPEFTGSFPNKHESSFGSSGSRSEVVFESTGGKVLACEKMMGKGEITSAKALTESWTLTGCRYAGSFSCSTAGAKEGEIQIASVKGILVYLSKAKKEVGIAYAPLEKLETPPLLASIKCGGGGSIELRRTLLAHITPVNSLTSKFEMQFRAFLGKQEPNKYENEGHEWAAYAEFSLDSGPFEEAGLMTQVGSFDTQSKTEIKA